MSGGGGGGNQTTTSSPWAGQQPYLTDLFSQAQNLWQTGSGQSYYPGQTVAPFSPQSQMYFDRATHRGMYGSPQEHQMGNYLSNTMGQPNLDPNMIVDPAQQAARGIQPGQEMLMQGGQVNPFMAQAANIYGGAGQPNQMAGSAANAMAGMTGYGGLGEASQYAGAPTPGALPASQQYAINQMGVGGAGNQQLAQTAQGGYLGSNPYLDQMFDTASGRAGEAFQEQTMPAIAAQFGAAGRTGSGLHQEMGQNAMRQFGRDLQGMAADIYSPAYESERNRMMQAAGQGSQAGLGAAQLGGSLYGQQNQAELGRLGLGSDLYLGERGLGQQGANMLGQLGYGYDQLGQQGGSGLAQLGLGQAGNMLSAGGQLGQLGLGGLDPMMNMYGQIGDNQFRAASMVPSYSGLEYANLDRLGSVGGQIEDQTGRLMDANFNRYMYEQGAPWNALQNYGNIVQGMPGGYGTTTAPGGGGGSRWSQAAGGAMAGSALGPWGMAGGALMGLLL